MAKRGNRHRIKQLKKEIKKNYKLLNLFLIYVGVLFLSAGIYKFVYLNPSIVVSARYLQPRIDNGGVMIIIGIILIACSVYRSINKQKVLKSNSENEIEKDNYE